MSEVPLYLWLRRVQENRLIGQHHDKSGVAGGPEDGPDLRRIDFCH